MTIKWAGLELALLSLEMELERVAGGGAAAALPPSGAAPLAESSPPPHDPDAMTAAATSALAARLESGAWPPMPMGALQQARARIRTARSWTSLMQEWAEGPPLSWDWPAGMQTASFVRLLLVEMGPWLDDLRA